MSIVRGHLKLGAPAVVMLATIVNVAASDAAAAAMREPFSEPASDLSWVLSGGATKAGQSARVAIARKAVSSINSQDRLSGAQSVQASAVVAVNFPLFEQTAAPRLSGESAAIDHARSSCQHSAP